MSTTDTRRGNDDGRHMLCDGNVCFGLCVCVRARVIQIHNQNGVRTLTSSSLLLVKPNPFSKVLLQFYSPARLAVAPRDLNRVTSQPGQNRQPQTKQTSEKICVVIMQAT